MHPINERFEQDVRESFERQPMLALLGARLAHIAPGDVAVELPFRPDLRQQSGTLHAGAIATIADTASGYAALTLMPAGSTVLSVEFKVNLLAPGRGTLFVARARVVRAGRTLTTTLADVFDGETLIATMLGTMIRR